MTEPVGASAVTLVCARSSHPKGYGYPDGTAHGYVLLFVTGVPRDKIMTATQLLNRTDVREPFGPSWEDWYGGQFDAVTFFDGDPRDVVLPNTVRHFATLGDNRAYTTISWADLTAGSS